MLFTAPDPPPPMQVSEESMERLNAPPQRRYGRGGGRGGGGGGGGRGRGRASSGISQILLKVRIIMGVMK